MIKTHYDVDVPWGCFLCTIVLLGRQLRTELGCQEPEPKDWPFEISRYGF